MMPKPLLMGLYSTALLICSVALPTTAQAQSLDLKFDSAVSSGIIVGPAGREVSIGRSPLLLDLDLAFIFDDDQTLEWVMGTLIQMEYTPAVALNPQVRLRRRKGPFEGFAGLGVPVYIAPLTRIGTEFSFGFSFPAESALAFLANINLRTYFMGDDLPDETTVFMFTGAVGLRLRF